MGLPFGLGAEKARKRLDSKAASQAARGTSQTRTRQRTSTVGFAKKKVDDFDDIAVLTSFDVLFKLGEGGFGRVLLCRKKDTQELYAIKSINKQRIHAADAEYVLGESDALQNIRHPFIMEMHGAFQDAMNFYFVFEFIGGGDLYEHVKAHNTFPIDWCTFYIAEMALALDHIHTRGYMYRDLKMENVLVSDKGHAKLGDFGLAKKIKEGGARGTMAGTELAMAPEMRNGEKYGPAVDWWALGVLLCDMHMGGTPFPVVGRDVTLLELVKIFKKEKHLDHMPPGLHKQARKAIAGLLAVPVEKRVRTLAMLKEQPLFGSIDFEKLEKLEITAPLEKYVGTGQGPQLLMGGSNSSKKTGEHGAALEDVERRFSVFMSDAATSSAATSESDSAAAPKIDISSTALCDAAARGDVAALRAIANAGGDINLGDYDRRTAIHLAASEGLLKVVQYLVDELGAMHSPVDRWLNTPLDDALRHNHSSVVEFLARRGAVKSEHGGLEIDMSSTALCDAAARGDVAALKAIANAGGNVNLGDYDRRTAIHLAASEGNLAVVSFLVDDCGALHSPEDRWGSTPLDDALNYGHSKVAEYLQSKGAVKRSEGHRPVDISSTALCNAASEGDADALRSIMEAGGNLNLGDYDKRTAMHLAASEGKLEVLRFLVGHGADPSPYDRWGGTPLDDATRAGHPRVIEFLKTQGAQHGTTAAVGMAPSQKSGMRSRSWMPLSLLSGAPSAGDAKQRRASKSISNTNRDGSSGASNSAPATPEPEGSSFVQRSRANSRGFFSRSLSKSHKEDPVSQVKV